MNVQQFSIQWQKGQVTGIGSTFPYISALQDANKYQSFHVYNNGNGYFIVKTIGQTK